MKKVHEGKTKNVFRLDSGNYLLKMKDDITGENGQIDPGGNAIIGKIEGMGHASLQMSGYYFSLLNEKDILTHYIEANFKENTMTVRPAETFGEGIEVICRFRAYGSFVKRYAKYVASGQELDSLVEITLKDDSRGDPLIGKEALIQLGLLKPEEYEQVFALTRQIASIIKNDLELKGLELYDIKFEYGRFNGKIMLIDDISGGNMRVFKDGKQLDPLELSRIVAVW